MSDDLMLRVQLNGAVRTRCYIRDVQRFAEPDPYITVLEDARGHQLGRIRLPRRPPMGVVDLYVVPVEDQDVTP